MNRTTNLEALKKVSDSDIVITMNKHGDVELIKNGFDSNSIKCIGDCTRLLWKLFNQRTEIEFFNAAFELDFNNLIKKHYKRMDFDENQIISLGEELWSTSRSNCN